MIRDFYPGIGQAVAERTILRKKSNGFWETWEDVAHRVAEGNSLLSHNNEEQKSEFELLKRYISKGVILMSGRHLQHGDATQPSKNQEIFTNCSTSSTSFALFYLLMNGSGVGRSYDDDIMFVNWDNAPTVQCIIDHRHPDFDPCIHTSVRDARHKYGDFKNIEWFEIPSDRTKWKNSANEWFNKTSKYINYYDNIIWLQIPDTREGWAKALEIYETLAFEKIHRDKLLILDFSVIRPKDTPINGMQNRPASGPTPIINAFNKIMTIRNAKMDRWKQSMYIDHYFAECVLVGGARRAARIATKSWLDPTILEFIKIKRPIEYNSLSFEEVIHYRNKNTPSSFLWSSNNTPSSFLWSSNNTPSSFLWSSNNSVMVDDQFWELLNLKNNDKNYNIELAIHAREVFKLSTQCAYGDGTGEPGLVNVHRLHSSKKRLDELINDESIGSEKYQIENNTKIYINKIIKKIKHKKHFMIVNPCSEIPIASYGAYCIVADTVPFHADTIDEAEEAFRATTRALIRVNKLKSLYSKEVERTNRIGVSITGIHEFAWKFFKYGFEDLIDENKSLDFWLTLTRFSNAVRDEAKKYSEKYGYEIPFTTTTIKPAGTTSKLFGLTEGWHLPAMSWYLRWVQFRDNDPLVEKYQNAGYPTKKLTQYKNTTIVGFPTSQVLTTLGLKDKLKTTTDVTPEEQYKWIMLGEKYWIIGTSNDGSELLEDQGGQISYTLKYNPKNISYDQFSQIMLKYQSQIKCCSVMPQENTSSYEYLPEEKITETRYQDILNKIKLKIKEDVDKIHIDCSSGACPIEFNK